MVGSHGVTERLESMQYIAFLFEITCIFNNEIHSSIHALLKSKVHIYIMIEEHIKL